MAGEIIMQNRVEITKELHNCKIDACPDKGKMLYTISVDDRKAVLSESDFTELINGVK